MKYIVRKWDNYEEFLLSVEAENPADAVLKVRDGKGELYGDQPQNQKKRHRSFNCIGTEEQYLKYHESLEVSYPVREPDSESASFSESY